VIHILIVKPLLVRFIPWAAD